MRLFDLPPRQQQHNGAPGQRVEEGTLTEKGARTLTEAGTETPSYCVGAAGNRNIFFVISFMKRAFSNSRRIIIGVSRGKQRRKKPFTALWRNKVANWRESSSCFESDCRTT